MIPDPGFWQGRRVLVTGHTGFKGAWLTLWLHQLGAEVVGYALAPDTEPSVFAAAGLADTMASHLADIRDADSVRSVVEQTRPEIVLHLAAQALVRKSYVDPVGTFDTNVMGTIHLLEAIRNCDDTVATVVVTSDKCYENREWVWPYRESEPMGGHDPYSASKGCAELVTAAWRRSFYGHARGLASARAGNVVGGGDWSDDRLVPDCVRAFRAGEPVVVRQPDSVRPWQHVLEPLRGYLLLAERLAADAEAFGEPWNFGPANDDAIPVGEVVDTLVAQWGDGASWRVERTDDLHEAGLLQVDASKARSRIGWRPMLPIRDGLAWSVEWYRRVADGAEAGDVTREQIERYCAIPEGQTT